MLNFLREYAAFFTLAGSILAIVFAVATALKVLKFSEGNELM
jgi:hypothetical protein